MIPMLDLVTITSSQGRSAYAVVKSQHTQELWSVQASSRRVLNDKGQEVTASAEGLAPPESVVKIDDLVTFEEKQFVVLDVQEVRIEGAISHFEIALKSHAES